MSSHLALMCDYAAGESSLVLRMSLGDLSSAPADDVLLCKIAETCLRAAQLANDVMKRSNVLQHLTGSTLPSVAGTDVFDCL